MPINPDDQSTWTLEQLLEHGSTAELEELLANTGPHPLRRRLPPDEIRKTIDNTRQILANAKARRAHDHQQLRAQSEARQHRSA